MRVAHLLIAGLRIDDRLPLWPARKAPCKIVGTCLRRDVVSRLIEIDICTLGQALRQPVVAALDVIALEGIRCIALHQVGYMHIAPDRLLVVEIGVTRDDVDGVELVEAPKDLLHDRLDQPVRDDVVRHHVRGPGIGDVVAPLDDDSGREATLRCLGELPACMLPIGSVRLREVEGLPVVRRLVGIAVESRLCTVPLGQRIDLEHIEALCGTLVEIGYPLVVCRIGEGSPDRIRQPEERLSVTDKMHSFD